MADEANGAGAAAPRLQILTQYIRDLSFENIAAQKGISSDGKPDLQVQINIDVQQRAEDRFEVILRLKLDSKVDAAPVFILEIDYAGFFLIQNVPADQMHPLLMIECPRLIFPFLRRVVSDVTRDGGYPPVNLEMVDFLGLYRAEMARRQAGEAPAQA
ncbi:MAG: protein-export chaperone SecB [Amaricoccus sp.]